MGGKIGIDATAKGPGEGYERGWPDKIEMRRMRSLVNRRWAESGGRAAGLGVHWPRPRLESPRITDQEERVADQDGTNRGQFLTLSTVGLGAMIGGVIGVPATAYILAPVTKEVSFDPVLLGEIDQLRPRRRASIPPPPPTSRTPSSPRPARGLAYVHFTGKTGTAWNAQDAMFIVFSNRCMHLGCPIAAVPSVGFQCPCHGGAYNTTGARTAGPPIRPLDRFQWEIRKDTELWITQRWSTDFNSDGQIHYYQVKSPGQPVTLPELGDDRRQYPVPARDLQVPK